MELVRGGVVVGGQGSLLELHKSSTVDLDVRVVEGRYTRYLLL